MHVLRHLGCLSGQPVCSLQKMAALNSLQKVLSLHTSCCSAAWITGRSSTSPRTHNRMSLSSDGFTNSNNQQDLRRFLQEIGTNPKEARFWLKHFHQNVEPHRLFAVIQVDQSVFQQPEMLDHLCSCLSFLHRNDMKCVVVHGRKISDDGDVTIENIQDTRLQMVSDSVNLVRTLEAYGAPVRVFFGGSCVLQGEPSSTNTHRGEVKQVNLQPVVDIALDTGHIPVIQSLGESSTGQLLNLDVCHVTAALAKVMTPIKVMYLNTEGGITDGRGEVVANVHLPMDLMTPTEKEWCTPLINKQLEHINDLLNELPPQTSAVVTSADTLLKELFTHNGSGTQFKITEPIYSYSSLEDIDLDRLLQLINRSFGKPLKPDYFESIKHKVHTVYLSKGYNAAAIITTEVGSEVAYLDKFAVSTQSQGEGVSDMLWSKMRHDFKELFWRSRGTNWINPWYFKKSEGSWSNGDWTVFWYGITDTTLASELVRRAVDLKPSFETPSSAIKVRQR